MNDEAPVQAPTDIKDIAIHLSYMRRDMQKMQVSLDNITSNYVPISVHLEFKADTERKIDLIEDKMVSQKEFTEAKTESEKDRKELRSTVKLVYIGMGGLAVLQFIAPYIISHLFK